MPFKTLKNFVNNLYNKSVRQVTNPVENFIKSHPSLHLKSNIELDTLNLLDGAGKTLILSAFTLDTLAKHKYINEEELGYSTSILALLGSTLTFVTGQIRSKIHHQQTRELALQVRNISNKQLETILSDLANTEKKVASCMQHIASLESKTLYLKKAIDLDLLPSLGNLASQTLKFIEIVSFYSNTPINLLSMFYGNKANAQEINKLRLQFIEEYKHNNPSSHALIINIVKQAMSRHNYNLSEDPKDLLLSNSLSPEVKSLWFYFYQALTSFDLKKENNQTILNLRNALVALLPELLQDYALLKSQSVTLQIHNNLLKKLDAENYKEAAKLTSEILESIEPLSVTKMPTKEVELLVTQTLFYYGANFNPLNQLNNNCKETIKTKITQSITLFYEEMDKSDNLFPDLAEELEGDKNSKKILSQYLSDLQRRLELKLSADLSEDQYDHYKNSQLAIIAMLKDYKFTLECPLTKHLYFILNKLSFDAAKENKLLMDESFIDELQKTLNKISVKENQNCQFTGYRIITKELILAASLTEENNEILALNSIFQGLINKNLGQGEDLGKEMQIATLNPPSINQFKNIDIDINIGTLKNPNSGFPLNNEFNMLIYTSQ